VHPRRRNARLIQAIRWITIGATPRLFSRLCALVNHVLAAVDPLIPRIKPVFSQLGPHLPAVTPQSRVSAASRASPAMERSIATMTVERQFAGCLQALSAQDKSRAKEAVNGPRC
jgi:hypothetical protein